jgi:2-oxoisovalerate dehydrogenase E2 component (dihydrolipoyl transacylase)
MGVHIIKMPDIGEGIAELELVAWHVKPGDSIDENQILADVMTDKATVEIPSPVAGTVLELGGRVGEIMAVGSDMIRIETMGAADDQAPSSRAAAPVAAPPAMAPAKTNTTAAAPVAKPAAVAPETVSTGSAKAVTRLSEKPIASPSVRRRAWELGVELQLVPASGTAGRITHEDLIAYSNGHSARGASRSGPRDEPNDQETTIPVIGLRRKIAQKMQDSKRRIPHFSYVEEIDVTELEAVRGQLNRRWDSERGHLTVLPLLARAIVIAVREYPHANARFDDENGVVTRFGAVHLGIATQTDAGLMVPVVRHAEVLDLWAFAHEIERLADAARTGKATRGELSGSTITITSLGALGGIVTTPVINHPEVAIVGVNRIVERPMMRSGLVVPRLMMNLSSSFDHRVVDGAIAARFVQRVRELLESPAMLLVE